MSELLVNTIKKADGTGGVTIPADTGTFVVKDGSNDVTLNNITATGVYLGGTGAANYLDDYEEGSWSPTIAFNGGTTGITYTTQRGWYVKTGPFVHCWFDVQLSSKGSSTGGMQIRSLPFTATAGAEGRGGFVATYFDSFTGLNSSLVGRVESNTNYFPISHTNATISIGAVADISNTNATDSSRLQGLVTIYSDS